MARRLSLHPACKLFPGLNEAELQGLADDIKANGLQNPIVLLDGKILDGRNRHAACKLAGVEPHFIDWDSDGSPVEWVISQNLIRRHLTASQRAVVALDLLPMLEKEAKQRQRLSNGRGKKGAKSYATFSDSGKASEVAARITRTNARYVEVVKAISSEATELVEQIRSGELNVAQAKRLATIQRQQANEKKAMARLPKRKSWTITDNQTVVKCQAVVADPPYGITGESWEPDDLEGFTRDWCRRWSKCDADLIAIFWSQEYLWDGRNWFDDSLDGYQFQQLLTWHASINWAPKNRKRFKESWEPIFLYRKIGSNRQVLPQGHMWGGDLNNLDCHVAAAPQSNNNGHMRKQHPCQKPVSVMRWLINALTEPGEKVVSPFCGVSPCGIAAVQLGRKYHGIEISRKYRRIAEERIAAYGSDAVK